MGQARSRRKVTAAKIAALRHDRASFLRPASPGRLQEERGRGQDKPNRAAARPDSEPRQRHARDLGD
jgi:hypothetical protein